MGAPPVAMKALGSGYSTEVLIAGRPGSWESSTLLGRQIGGEVSAGRIDAETRAVVEEIVGRWVLGSVVDQAGGWESIRTIAAG
ncbi:hypothetical protein [Nonomuraea sp. NPDC004354]